MKSYRSRITVSTAVALSALAAGLLASPASACTSRVEGVRSDWHDMSFAPPSKPSQARVVGRYGHEITAGQYNFLHGQIRQAHRECRTGQPEIADRRATHAQGVLARATGRGLGTNAPERFVGRYDRFGIVE